jgi:hypothetical protein
MGPCVTVILSSARKRIGSTTVLDAGRPWGVDVADGTDLTLLWAATKILRKSLRTTHVCVVCCGHRGRRKRSENAGSTESFLVARSAGRIVLPRVNTPGISRVAEPSFVYPSRRTDRIGLLEELGKGAV